MLLYTSSSLGQCTDMLIIPLINYTVRGEIQSQRPLNIYLLDGYSPQSICCVSAPASLFRSSMCITWDKQRKQANKGAEHWLKGKINSRKQRTLIALLYTLILSNLSLIFTHIYLYKLYYSIRDCSFAESS